jgi:type-F conjugative transfer system pilin assembly protein TrbC
MKISLLLMAALLSQFAQAQEISRAYIFVSSATPRESLVSLAKEASVSGIPIIVNGLGKHLDIPKGQSFANEINRACCSRGPISTWYAHPELFQRFQIKEVPAFVIVHSDGKEFSKVSGDMALGNALKFFAKDSQHADIRAYASSVYQRTFSNYGN